MVPHQYKRIVLFTLLLVSFKGQVVLSQNVLADSTPHIDYFWPDCKMPTFPGGQFALCKFITENLKYPEKAIENSDTGKVQVMFIVSDVGSVQHVKVRKSSGFSLLDSAAISVIKIMPKWTPGTKNGKPVAVSYILPIKFELTDKGKSKRDQCEGWGK